MGPVRWVWEYGSNPMGPVLTWVWAYGSSHMGLGIWVFPMSNLILMLLVLLDPGPKTQDPNCRTQDPNPKTQDPDYRSRDPENVYAPIFTMLYYTD